MKIQASIEIFCAISHTDKIANLAEVHDLSGKYGNVSVFVVIFAVSAAMLAVFAANVGAVRSKTSLLPKKTTRYQIRKKKYNFLLIFQF